MRTTLNDALEMAKIGDWNRAWVIAQQDDGLLEGVTKERWIQWAKKILCERSRRSVRIDKVFGIGNYKIIENRLYVKGEFYGYLDDPDTFHRIEQEIKS